MCDVLWEVPGCVTKCDKGRGPKFSKNSVTYFMDGPLHSVTEVGGDEKANKKKTAMIRKQMSGVGA